MKDALFVQAKGMHRWHVACICNRLIFFEYNERQLEGIRSNAWQELIDSVAYHPLQEVFRNNQDLFNVILEWDGHFDVLVLRLDNTIQMLNGSPS